MRNAFRPLGRFFCLVALLSAWAMAPAGVRAQTSGPAMTQVTEGLFGHKSGADKKNAAMTLALNTIQATDAVAGNNIVDAGKFQDGLGRVIDGVVACLNASSRAKTKTT